MWQRLRRKAMLLAVCLVLFPLIAWAGGPVRFAVTDIVGLEELQREYGAFRTVW